MPDSPLYLQSIIILVLIAALIVGIFVVLRRPRTQQRTEPIRMNNLEQQAVEQIVGDSSLTDEMDDPEASRLLDWASGLAKRIAAQTSGMDESQAQQAIGTQLPNLRALVRRINTLVGTLGSGADADEIAQNLRRIAEAAAQVPGVAVTTPEALQISAEELAALPPGEALARILSYITKEDTDDETQA